MRIQITFFALLVTLSCIIISCSKNDESEDINELTESNYTQDGYFDGMMYYKIMPIVENEVEVTKCEKSAKTVEIPSYLIINGKKYAITSIGQKAFSSCTDLTSITISNRVKSIGYSAFQGCSGLTSVEIPDSVTFIDIGAFWDCSGLASVEIPNSVTRIGNYAFCSCSNLTSVKIPNDVKFIGAFTFYGCSGLKSITIGNSVESIDNHAFGGCTNLHSVNSKIMNPENIYFGTTPFSLIDTLFVPKGKVEPYLSSHWKKYFRIITDGDNTKEVL